MVQAPDTSQQAPHNRGLATLHADAMAQRQLRASRAVRLPTSLGVAICKIEAEIGGDANSLNHSSRVEPSIVRIRS